MASTKKDSVKITTVNSFDIYLDPENGHFFFTLKTGDKPRVEFATLRAAEDAARGDQPPVTVIVVGHNTYQHPEVVEVIGFSGWNLVTTKYRRLGLWRVFAYDEALLGKLNAAAAACSKAHQEWTWAVEAFEHAGHKIEVDWQDDHYKSVDSEHQRAEGGILRYGKD